MRVKNPYLRLFFLIIVESKKKPMAKIITDFNADYVINLFDFVAICCKFLDQDSLRAVLDEKIKIDISKGNLQVFALIGLKSEHSARVLQNYIDNTGDLQTAAYVAAYIATALSQPGIA